MLLFIPVILINFPLFMQMKSGIFKTSWTRTLRFFAALPRFGNHHPRYIKNFNKSQIYMTLRVVEQSASCQPVILEKGPVHVPYPIPHHRTLTSHNPFQSHYTVSRIATVNYMRDRPAGQTFEHHILFNQPPHWISSWFPVHAHGTSGAPSRRAFPLSDLWTTTTTSPGTRDSGQQQHQQQQGQLQLQQQYSGRYPLS